MNLSDKELRRAVITDADLHQQTQGESRLQIQALLGVLMEDCRQLRRYLKISASQPKRTKKGKA